MRVAAIHIGWLAIQKPLSSCAIGSGPPSSALAQAISVCAKGPPGTRRLPSSRAEPLARLLVGYASGRQDIKDAVDGALKALNVPVAALFSTLGRTAARGIETQLVAGWAMEFYGQLLANLKNGWSIQVNAAKDEATANAVRSRLQEKGFNAYVMRVNLQGETWYRVRVGRFPTMEAATAAVSRLKSDPSYARAFLVND